MSPAPELGRAVLELATDSAKFHADLTAAKTRVQGLGSSMVGAGQQAQAFGNDVERAGRKATSTADNLSRRFEKLGSTIAVGLGVASIGVAIQKYTEYGSRINDLSAKAGMGVEAFQRLSYAAKMNGGDMELVAQGAVKMSKALIEGDKSTVAAVRALGLNVDDLKKMDPADAFMAIGDAIARVPNPMEQAAIATKLFGKAGGDYLPMFKGNLKATADEASRLGLVMSKETVEAADRLGDSLDKLKTAGQGLLAEALGPIVPQIESLVNWFVQLPGPTKQTAIYLAEVGAALFTINRALNLIGSASALKFLMNPATAALLGVGLVGYQAWTFGDRLEAQNAPLSTGPIVGGRLTLAEAQKQTGDQGAMPTVITPRTPYTGGGGGGAAAKAAKVAPNYGPWWQTYGLWNGTIRQSGLADNPLASTALTNGLMVAPSVSGSRASFASPSWLNASAFGGSLTALPQNILGALMGGGNVGQTIGGALGTGLFSDLGSKLLTKTGLTGKLGEMLGSVIPGVGGILGSLVGPLLGKLFGPSKTQQAGRSADQEADALKAQLIQQYGSLEAIRKLGGGTGEALYQAFARRGVDGLKLVNAALDKFKKNLAIESQISDLEAQLAGLRGSLAVGYDQVKAIAEKYGADPNSLGGAVQQLGTTANTKELLEDFQALERAGVSGAAATAMMSKQLNQLVQDSITYGTAIPANMRPVLQFLVDQGMLTDAAGNKLTDLASLSWGEDVETDAEKTQKAIESLTAAIKELRDALIGVGQAAGNLPGVAPPSPPPEPPPDYHTGGIVRAWRRAHAGLFVGPSALAAGEVPIIAQTGEGILSRRGMAALGALNGGGFGASQTIVVQLGEREILRSVVEGMPQYLRLRGVPV